MSCEINLFIVGMITASFGEVIDEIAGRTGCGDFVPTWLVRLWLEQEEQEEPIQEDGWCTRIVTY